MLAPPAGFIVSPEPILKQSIDFYFTIIIIIHIAARAVIFLSLSVCIIFNHIGSTQHTNCVVNCRFGGSFSIATYSTRFDAPPKVFRILDHLLRFSNTKCLCADLAPTFDDGDG